MNFPIKRKDIRVVYTARQMKKAIHELDTTRPVTIGFAIGFVLMMVLDVVMG